MNPRLFCRETSYQKALVLTYSFDPIFFEQVVLPDLWAGRSSDILVLGDRVQLEVATQAVAGQLWHLGRHYLLGSVRHPGSFHPKVVLRLGAKDGVVMVGSGNVTSSGWGGNQELGTVWTFGPGHTDNGAWLHGFLVDVMSWCSHQLEMDCVRRMKDVPWLAMTPADVGVVSRLLYSNEDRTLASALSQRWGGRRFDEVKVLTGSTDESGAFLRWAQSTFGITRATIALTPALASLVSEKIADLPLELRLIAAPTDRPLHAKLYWFDGPDGPAAVMGSANCSRAAWLLPPADGGNAETIVVYDEPRTSDFEAALKLFDLPSQNPAELLLPEQAPGPEKPAHRREYQLIGLRWDKSTSCIDATISPTPSPEANVELVFGDRRLPMVRVFNAEGSWACEISEGVGLATAFASVRISLGASEWSTQQRWIDDLAALHQASHAARLLEPLRNLERGAGSVEQKRMLEELQEVAYALFHDPDYARDPVFGVDRKTKQVVEPPPPPVNPKDLIVHLEDDQESLPNLASTAPGTLSLSGILQLLFDAKEEEGGISAAADDEEIDEGQLPDGETKPQKKKAHNRAVAQELPPVEDKHRARLAEQIVTFLHEMASDSFAERCTATQLVQAVSFPLAVALRGQSRGWVSADNAERWALAIFSILFRGTSTSRVGLLRRVEQRYVQNERKAIFDDVIGDGTLWVVLVATLGNARWHGLGTEIDKAVALKEVFTAPCLVASAQPAHILGLLGRSRIDDAKAYVSGVAPRVTDLLERIDGSIRLTWKSEIRLQLDRALVYRAGDLLWRDKVGWAVCLAEGAVKAGQRIQVRLRGAEMEIASGYYVNVTDLANREPLLLSLLDDLRSAVSADQKV